MIKKKILYLYEKNLKSGNGHYTRSKNYYEYLKNFFDIDFTNFKNFQYYNKKNSFDFYIFDLKNYNLDFFKKNKLFNKSLTFDNFKNFSSRINISIFDHNPKIRGTRLKGLKYIYINSKKFKKLKKNKHFKKKLFISVGSKDINGFIPKIIKKLKKEKIKCQTKVYLPNSKLKKENQKKFLQDFITSDYCIVNGGMTMIESIFLKKKCIILPQTKDEKKFTQYLKKKKIISYIGLTSIKKLKNDLNDQKKMIVAKYNLNFDNRGHYRLKKILNNILTKKN